MASFWSFIKTAAASIPNAATGKVNLFSDNTNSGIPSMKDESGVVTAFGGANPSSTLPTAETLGDAGAIGTGTTYARADHAHPMTALTDTTHGNRGGGALHPAAVNGGANGFLIGTDKAKLDLLAAPDGSTLEVGGGVLREKDAGTTNAKLANMVQQTVKGRAVGAGTGAPVDLTSTQVAALIDPATASLQGAMAPFQFKKLATYTDFVNDLGCDPTGTADDTAKIQAWHDALTGPAIGFIPPGATPRLGSNVNLSKNDILIWGANRRTSGFLTSTATGNMFTVTGDSVIFENLRFLATAANVRTAGFAVEFQAASDSSGCFRCDVVFMWSCFRSSGPLQFFYDLTLREYGANAINGACILIEGSGDRYIDHITTDSTVPSAGHAGIRVNECSSLTLTNFNIIHAGNAMELTPTSTKTIASVNCVQGYFDTSVNGLVINGTAANGSVYRSSFTRCWFGSHTGSGIVMNGVAAGTAQFDGIRFTECDIFGNSNFGISCPLGGGNWSVTASNIAGNTTAGISVTPGTNHNFSVTDCTIGPVAAFGANGTGVTVATGAYKRIAVHDNDISGNTTAAITDAGPATATLGRAIYNNYPYLPLGTPTGGGARVSTILTIAATQTTVVILPIPANSAQVGTTLRITVSGQSSSTGILTLQARVGATADAQNAAATNAVAATAPTVAQVANAYATASFLVTFSAIGAAGNVNAQIEGVAGQVAFGTAAAARASGTGLLAVDTTSQKYVSLSLATSVGNFLVANAAIEVVAP